MLIDLIKAGGDVEIKATEDGHVYMRLIDANYNIVRNVDVEGDLHLMLSELEVKCGDVNPEDMKPDTDPFDIFGE